MKVLMGLLSTFRMNLAKTRKFDDIFDSLALMATLAPQLIFPGMYLYRHTQGGMVDSVDSQGNTSSLVKTFVISRTSFKLSANFA